MTIHNAYGAHLKVSSFSKRRQYTNSRMLAMKPTSSSMLVFCMRCTFYEPQFHKIHVESLYVHHVPKADLQPVLVLGRKKKSETFVIRKRVNMPQVFPFPLNAIERRHS